MRPTDQQPVCNIDQTNSNTMVLKELDEGLMVTHSRLSMSKCNKTTRCGENVLVPIAIYFTSSPTLSVCSFVFMHVCSCIGLPSITVESKNGLRYECTTLRMINQGDRRKSEREIAETENNRSMDGSARGEAHKTMQTSFYIQVQTNLTSSTLTISE